MENDPEEIAKEEFASLLEAAKSLLSDRNFKESRVYAVKAQILYPENPQVRQVLAVADILFAFSKTHRISETVINWYKFLGIPLYCNDVDNIIKPALKRIDGLINPNCTHDRDGEVPLVKEAFDLVTTASNVLAGDSTIKSRYDRNLKLIEKESRTGEKRRRSTNQSKSQTLSEKESDEKTDNRSIEKEIRQCIMCLDAFQFYVGSDIVECENCISWIQELTTSHNVSSWYAGMLERVSAGKTVGEEEECEKLLAAAKSLLSGHNFKDSRVAAITAQILYPENPQVRQVLAIDDILIAASKANRISETVINCYSILEVPLYCNDIDNIIKPELKRIDGLINPNCSYGGDGEVPLAREALNIVYRANYILAGDSKLKSRYDRNLKLIIAQESRTGGKRRRRTTRSKADRQRLSEEESDAMTVKIPDLDRSGVGELIKLISVFGIPTGKDLRVIKPQACIMCWNDVGSGSDNFECADCTSWIQELLLDDASSGSTGIFTKAFDLSFAGDQAFYPAGEEDDDFYGAGDAKIWAMCPKCSGEYEYDKYEYVLTCKNEECREPFLASKDEFRPQKKTN